MSNNKKKLNWCLANKSRMKKINPNNELSKEHIRKAKHNDLVKNAKEIVEKIEVALSNL